MFRPAEPSLAPSQTGGEACTDRHRTPQQWWSAGRRFHVNPARGVCACAQVRGVGRWPGSVGGVVAL
jgi:hypothetical protein